MATNTLSSEAYWYVIHTHPRQEERAEKNLRAWNFETFGPRLKVRRHNEYTNESTYVIKHLFPRYIFVKFNVGKSLHKILFTRGVNSVVSLGSRPIPSDEVVDVVRLRVGPDNLVTVSDYLDQCEFLSRGDAVLIKGGPFKHLMGVFEREMKDSERVMVLLATVSYQAHIVLDRGLVSKINAPSVEL